MTVPIVPCPGKKSDRVWQQELKLQPPNCFFNSAVPVAMASSIFSTSFRTGFGHVRATSAAAASDVAAALTMLPA